MTVSSIEPVNNYTGNSSNTKFDFDFLIENEAELIVQHTSSNGTISVLQNGVDYSIHEIGNSNGSYITFPILGSTYNKLAPDEKISLMLTLTIKQEKEIRNSLFFNFDTLEWMFDYIIRILQVVSRRLTRTLQIPEGRDNFNMILPVAKANNVFKWNETEDAIENYDIIAANTAFQTGVNLNIAAIEASVYNANNTADNAVTISNTAVSTANTAEIKADSAISTANSAETKSDNALSTASTALTTAASAVTTSNTALNSASTAVTTATQASDKVDEFGETIETVIQAASQINALEQAVSTATTSATLAYNSASTAATAATTASEKAQLAVDAASLIEQPDWSETDTTSKAYIQNKPTLASVATSGNYNDLLNKPNGYNYTNILQQIYYQYVLRADNGQLDLYVNSSAYPNQNYGAFLCVPTEAVTFAFDVGSNSNTNGVSDYESTFVITTFELIIVMRTVQSLTFPSEVVWLDANAPDLSETGVYFLAFRTLDNGNHWAGNLQGKWDLDIDFINAR